MLLHGHTKIWKGFHQVDTTYNWIGHYYTIDTSCQVKVKSKLCYNSQTRYK
jgi:hypothetical protein